MSCHAGVNMAFAEAVGAGCKRLALSSPCDPERAEKMMEPTRVAAETYDVGLGLTPRVMSMFVVPLLRFTVSVRTSPGFLYLDT